MNAEKIKTVRTECNRLLDRIKAFESAAKEHMECEEHNKNNHGKWKWAESSVVKTRAAVRRTSMDLTRALADMRKSGG